MLEAMFCEIPVIASAVSGIPQAVTDGEGRDWKAALSSNDMELAIPFEPLPGQFQGLATPHYLELTFDEDVVRDASKLRLLLNGWFFWTDASVNMAAARTPPMARATRH